MSTTDRLPGKLSDLLYVALEDLEKVERDPRYTIDMDVWHEPNYGKCAVCAAGSVMAMRLGVEPSKPGNLYDFDDDTSDKLYAIDRLRVGDIGYAAELLGIHLPESMPRFVADGEYAYDSLSSYNRKEWKQHMAALMGILQAEGL